MIADKISHLVIRHQSIHARVVVNSEYLFVTCIFLYAIELTTYTEWKDSPGFIFLDNKNVSGRLSTYISMRKKDFNVMGCWWY